MTNILNKLISEPAEIYHAQRGQFLSSHALGDFRRCPRFFRDKEIGAIPDKDNGAYRLGRAVHCLTLEGRAAYEKDFIIGGPINERTGKSYGRDTKAFAAWAADQSGEILTDAEGALCERLATAVHNHRLAAELLAEGQAEGVVRHELFETPCQIRCDWINPKRGLVDLKTCDDLHWFERDAKRFGYIAQLAFYRAVLRAVSDCTVPVYIIAVEKQQPHRVGVWQLDDAALELAEIENQGAIEMLKGCRAYDSWPTGFENLRILAS